MDALVPVGRLRPAPWSQTVPDEVLALKMAKMVRRWGQLAPVIIRTAEDGALEIVHGHRLFEAVRAAGAGQVKVFNVGQVTDPEAKALAFALHTLVHETNFAAVACLVADAVESGLHTCHDLASVSRFTQDRVEQFAKMARFDWTTIGTAEADGPAGPTQGGLWDEPEPEQEAIKAMAAADTALTEAEAVQASEAFDFGQVSAAEAIAAAPASLLSPAYIVPAGAVDIPASLPPGEFIEWEPVGPDSFGGEDFPHAPAAWSGAGPHEEQGPAPVFDEAGEADLLLAAMSDEGDEL